MKKGRVIIEAENFENDMALRDNVFPFGREGIYVAGAVLSRSDVKG
jgi:hypothetical protein